MNRVVTAVPGAEIPSAAWNTIQDLAAGLAQFTGLRIGGDGLRSDGAHIWVSPITGISFGSAPLSTAAETQYTLAGLTSGTWYYLYAFNNAGVVALEASTVVPDPARTYKNLDTTRLYLGCFRATGATSCIPFRASRGRYVYRPQGNAGSGDMGATRAYSSATGTTFVSQPLAQWVPNHARTASLLVSFAASASNDRACLRSGLDSTTDGFFPEYSTSGTDLCFAVELEPDGVADQQNIQYRVTTAGDPLTIVVTGFTE